MKYWNSHTFKNVLLNLPRLSSSPQWTIYKNYILSLLLRIQNSRHKFFPAVWLYICTCLARKSAAHKYHKHHQLLHHNLPNSCKNASAALQKSLHYSDTFRYIEFLAVSASRRPPIYSHIRSYIIHRSWAGSKHMQKENLQQNLNSQYLKKSFNFWRQCHFEQF